MRRTLQKRPFKLPHARLYLDDIETITNIFNDAVASKNFKTSTASESEIRYRIGDVEMDSISDLLEQGGSTTKLEIDLRAESEPVHSSCSIALRGMSSPYYYSWGFEENAGWALYGKIHDVFDKRRRVLRNVIADLPESVLWVIGISVSAIPIIVAALNIVVHSVFARIAVGALVATEIAIFLLGMFVYTMPNRVYLVRSHERSKVLSESRRKYWIAAITFMLGTVFTKFVEYLLARLFK